MTQQQHDTSYPVRLKYEQECIAIPGCPNEANASFKGDCYRAVHKGILYPQDFLPKAITEPHTYENCLIEKRCAYWALSMFDNLDQVKSLILRVEKYAPNFRKKIGDHCVRLTLSSKDGRRTKTGAQGHFSFFEAESFDAKAAVLDCVALFT